MTASTSTSRHDAAVHDLEWHRRGVGLACDDGSAPIRIAPADGEARARRLCTCKASRRRTCSHLEMLGLVLRHARQRADAIARAADGGDLEDALRVTIWGRLARLAMEGDPRPLDAARVDIDAGLALGPRGDADARWVVYRDDDPGSRQRFAERFGARVDVGGSAPARARAALLARLARQQQSPQERMFAERGMPTRGQAWETSVWHRLAYHALREGWDDGTFHPAIDPARGDFTLQHRAPDGRPRLDLVLPRKRVRAVLALLAEHFPDQADLALHPVPLRALFLITESTTLDRVEVRPVIRALQADGEARFFARDDLARFTYGDLVYVPELELLAELETPGRDRRFKPPTRMRLARGRVPALLEDHRDAVDAGGLVVDEALGSMQVWRDHDRIVIAPGRARWQPDDAIDERGWLWLDVRYGFGEHTVALADLLSARRRGLRHLETDDGWIDLDAPAFATLDALVDRLDPDDDDGGSDGDAGSRALRLHAGDLLRLGAAQSAALEIDDAAAAADDVHRDRLRHLLARQPQTPYAPPDGSSLRPYQITGVAWLSFLHEYGLAGLLCDDMGLGKTHQAMAFLVELQRRGVDGPCLVVCPTSVLSHWRRKMQRFGRPRVAVVHHGPQRHLPEALRRGDVVITSYGVLRRDAARFARVRFAAAIFDEIQQLKNRSTQAHRAAAQLQADFRLGLTGTPIENRLAELKNLFDLLLPGHLGTDADFQRRYGALDAAPRLDGDPARLEGLRRRIAPFLLRRRKLDVLAELPDKIEDERACALSDVQIALYRHIVEHRARPLADALARARDGDAIPNRMHIFAVLTALKQVCAHPALLLGDARERGGAYDDGDDASTAAAIDVAALGIDGLAGTAARDLPCGKWDLFRDLLEESLESGQKVAVFTQFRGMAALIVEHLRDRGVDHAGFTGTASPREREKALDRFQTRMTCRVFVGTLGAAGTGIDLTAASVVMHYDRWWTAAREDQATDRVYRIGQRRAVQVFKLITEGTLEEKIARMIARKRQLAAEVVEPSADAALPRFDRGTLLALLADAMPHRTD
ncbi:MAG: DEAD/DEAH box helicase [Acidobacteriota bacterium]